MKGGCAMDKKYYEDKMREILDREVNTDEDCIRQVVGSQQVFFSFLPLNYTCIVL